jgi:hypothetical protein
MKQQGARPVDIVKEVIKQFAESELSQDLQEGAFWGAIERY